jgi:tetratricopeptide (TPR) repeat protein
VDFAQIEPLLPGAAGCLLLVTSRARIPDLDGMVPLSLNPMSEADSMAMIGAIIGEHRLAGADGDARALVEVCGHLPLALRIAAARLHNRPMWTVRDLVRRLEVEERRLDELALGNRRVATAIEMSYQALPAEHRRLFRRLGLAFGNDVDVYSAAAIGGVSLVRADDMLEDLLDARLLQQPQANRYTLHGLLRSCALHRARHEDDEAEQRACLVRMLDYYLHTADAAAAQIHPGRRRITVDVPEPTAGGRAFGGQSDALAWFDQEQDNLLAAVGYVSRHGLDLYLCHLPRVVASYLQIRGRLHNHVDMLQASVMAATRRGDRLLEMVNLGALSSVFWQLGKYDEALDNMTLALANAETVEDRAFEGECLSRIGLLCENTGRFSEALHYLGRALRIHRETGDLFEEGVALTTLCSVQLALGQYQLAAESAQASLTAHRELDHGMYVVSALEGLAAAELGLGRHAEALGSLGNALRIAQDIGYLAGEAAVTMRYADACGRVGRLADARAHGMQALEILWTIQRPAVEAEALNILGVVLRQLGETTMAMARHTNALEIASRISCRLQTAYALQGIADVLSDLGDRAGADEHWRAALEHHHDMGTVEAGPLRARINRLSPR